MRSSVYVLVVTWHSSRRPDGEGLSRLASATSITHFMAISPLSARAFCPSGEISCPMDGAYLPQHVRQARRDGRLLGQVRDLLVVRKPLRGREQNTDAILFMQEPASCELATMDATL